MYQKQKATLQAASQKWRRVQLEAKRMEERGRGGGVRESKAGHT
jgi:hypothetical protein